MKECMDTYHLKKSCPLFLQTTSLSDTSERYIHTLVKVIRNNFKFTSVKDGKCQRYK